MIDNLNRNIEYLRISVTDRCNLRCMYCMPDQGVKWLAKDEMLSFDEITRLCQNFAKLGIRKVKITGGEPLVRKDLDKLIKMIKNIEGIDNVTLTTNGVLLEEQIDGLVQAGLDAVNISIDALNPEIFKKIAGRDVFYDVYKAIEYVTKYEQLKVKINCVPLKGINDSELVKIAEIAKKHRISVRFIEMMPIGLGASFKPYKEDELKVMLESHLGKMTYFEGKLGNGPCKYYTVGEFKGKIGFISAVSHQFCSECNRIRLTATGYLKACLQYDIGADLKVLLRNGCSDEELLDAMQNAIFHKPKGHQFMNASLESKEQDQRKMFQIGG